MDIPRLDSSSKRVTVMIPGRVYEKIVSFIEREGLRGEMLGVGVKFELLKDI